MIAYATFRLSNKFTKGEVVKLNPLTVWVRLKTGEIIKRHRMKHFVFITHN